MKYLKYGFYSFVSKPWFNIIIMTELAAILAAGNMVISIVNSRSVYYEPYADIIQYEGYIFTPREMRKKTNEAVMKKVYDSLQGNVDVVYSYNLQLTTTSEMFQNPLYHEDIKYRNLLCFDDRIFSKFRIPLTEGRWASSHKNSKGQIEAVVVTEREKDIKPGDTFSFSIPEADTETKKITFREIGEIVVTGIIAHGNYYPNTIMTGTETDSNGRKNTRDVRNMYTTGSLGNDDASILVSADAAPEFRNDLYIDRSTAFIRYISAPTDEIRSANKELLAGASGRFISMSDFKNSSDLYLYEQYIKLLPILIGVFVIVAAELICSAALNTKNQMRNYGIYFLCGARFRSCLKISAAYSAVILTGSLILGTSAYFIFVQSGYAKSFEQNFDINNIYITLVIITAMFLISLIIPFFMVKKTSPVEIIKA